MLYYIIPQKHVCFIIRNRKAVDLDGMKDNKKLGVVEGGLTVIKMYYMREKYLFFIKRKKKLRIIFKI